MDLPKTTWLKLYLVDKLSIIHTKIFWTLKVLHASGGIVSNTVLVESKEDYSD